MNKNLLLKEMISQELTQEQMANKLDLSDNSFLRKLNGMNEFTLKEIRKMEDILKMSINKSRAFFFDDSLEYTQINTKQLKKEKSK